MGATHQPRSEYAREQLDLRKHAFISQKKKTIEPTNFFSLLFSSSSSSPLATRPHFPQQTHTHLFTHSCSRLSLAPLTVSTTFFTLPPFLLISDMDVGINVEDGLEGCRICFDTEEDAESGKLISPCKCKGSQAVVHRNCLQKWRTFGGEKRKEKKKKTTQIIEMFCKVIAFMCATDSRVYTGARAQPARFCVEGRWGCCRWLTR